jgi:hypothetical protein
MAPGVTFGDQGGPLRRQHFAVRHRESDDNKNERGFEATPMRDGSNHDGADDDKDQFHPPIVAS